ncbi:hypothetical protein [Geobacter sp. AOG2]|uniref:hypothetical protein n=1 Tax=Geobacter sp. AOG2 TaxID=1566347 RepID=UPI001CC676AD|nr:hypothetical protein [Geobacter sp. AOG2]
MKKALMVFLAFTPIWGAAISAPVVCKISGSTFATAVNQGTMVIRFFWLVAFLFLSIVPIKIAKELSDPSYSKKIEILGAVLWLPGSFLNYYIINNIL